MQAKIRNTLKEQANITKTEPRFHSLTKRKPKQEQKTMETMAKPATRISFKAT